MVTKTIFFNAFKTLYDLAKREHDFYKIKPNTSTLFLTYRCNSKCKTCTMWQRPQSEEIKKEIDFNKWKIVIDKLADTGIKSTEIFGGNVLLRKEVLVPVLQYLYEKGIAIYFPTNQIGLDNDIAVAIVKYVKTVYISTDGLAGDQDKIRGIEGAFSLGESSIEKLLRLRNEIHRDCQPIKIVCNCTVSKFNYDRMENIVEYAIGKGFDEIHFEYAGEFEKSVIDKSKIFDILPDPYYIRKDESILANKKQAISIKNNIKNIKKKYKKEKILISTVNIESLSVKNLWQGTIPNNKCYVERNEITVDPYGNLVVCPFFRNYYLGNLLVMSLKYIWNNEKHRKFRKFQNKGCLPMCHHCILGVQRNPGLAKSLQRIYLTRKR